MENYWRKKALLILLIISREAEFEQIYVILIVKVYLPWQMNGI